MTLQELEGFTWCATALDLNMGYYTIRLDPAAFKMCTIIFPRGKYSYKRLSMGFEESTDIFQAQIMDLLASLEYAQAYINGLEYHRTWSCLRVNFLEFPANVRVSEMVD
jgi:hypothetical protein